MLTILAVRSLHYYAKTKDYPSFIEPCEEGHYILLERKQQPLQQPHEIAEWWLVRTGKRKLDWDNPREVLLHPITCVISYEPFCINTSISMKIYFASIARFHGKQKQGVCKCCNIDIVTPKEKCKICQRFGWRLFELYFEMRAAINADIAGKIFHIFMERGKII